MLTGIIPSDISAFQAYFWYVVGTSVLFAYFRFNKSLEAQGVYYDSLYKGIGRNFPIVALVLSVLQPLLAVLLIFQFGFLPFVYSFVAILVGMIAAQVLFGFVPFAQYIMPIVTVITLFLFAQTVG